MALRDVSREDDRLSEGIAGGQRTSSMGITTWWSLEGDMDEGGDVLRPKTTAKQRRK